MKNPLTPAGIEPAAFRFVAQQLNHCATAVPIYIYVCVCVCVCVTNYNKLRNQRNEMIKQTKNTCGNWPTTNATLVNNFYNFL